MEDVYPPRKDSYLLKEVVEERELDGKRVLDMGTGSGIIAVAAARQGADVTAVDINPRAVEAVQERAAEEDLDIDAVESDLFEDVTGRYDLIAFNPPYVPSEEAAPAGDGSWAGGEDGREVTDRFIEEVAAHLAEGGEVLLLQSSRNDVSRTVERLRGEELDAEVLQEEALHFEQLVVVRAEKSA